MFQKGRTLIESSKFPKFTHPPFFLTMSKRAQRIEERLKTVKQRSLFDTDGDLSSHNIIEGGRRSRSATKEERYGHQGTLAPSTHGD